MTRCFVPVLLALLLAQPAAAQPQPWSADAPVPPDAATIDAMVQVGELAVVSRRADRYLSDRTHEYLAQYVNGIPVHGGGISRQRANGATVSVFGRLHPDINIATTPALSLDDAVARLSTSGARPVDTPTLVVLPLLLGDYALAYRATLSDAQETFIDAHTGDLLWQHSVVREQRAIGTGTGIAGDRKNVSTMRAGSVYRTIDEFRPAEIVTLDMDFSLTRTFSLIMPGPSGTRRWNDNDVATDSDNEWEDPAAVDAHVHTGWAYDYFAQRHNWYGVDGANGRIISLVNTHFGNAFYSPPPFGPEGTGVFVYGETADGVSFATEDIVGHELMHCVVSAAFHQRTGLQYPGGRITGVLGPRSFRRDDGRIQTCANTTYRFFDGRVRRPMCSDGRFILWMGDGLIIKEAYGDIVGHSVEFFHEDRAGSPLAGDYESGEHLLLDGRVSDNPRSREIVPGIPYPDATRGLLRWMIATPDGRTFSGGGFWLDELFIDGRYRGLLRADSLGAHFNSTVLSHAFYLAIEGGTNATTGRSVTGVGPANRADVERAFFRAIVDLMPLNASLGDTARVIRRSAIDLFGFGSTTHTAVTEALRAVGLLP